MFSLKYIPHREPDEKVVFVLHRHKFVFGVVALAFLILAILPFFIYFLISKEMPQALESQFWSIFLKLLLFLFYMFWWMLFYYAFLDYYLDVWMVTNYRVIGVEQRGLFHRVVAEYKLFRIQDVLAEQKGFFPTVIDYGNVHIQTAGEQEVVNFKQVPNPNHVARELIRLIEFNKKKLAAKELKDEVKTI
ncbi:PH domain-containing protein [Candidatus Kuenenbacteria bacterium]|nr:PH domain-containing protein [Candidatus Kuenenbacteria bacterium]